jgi:transcriptional regulator with XRE-family HTH domain
METFAQRLKRFRQSSSFTQKEMAEKLGVASTTYREWEYGRAITGMPYPKIAEILGVSLKELLTGEKSEMGTVNNLLNSIETSVRKMRIELESF